VKNTDIIPAHEINEVHANDSGMSIPDIAPAEKRRKFVSDSLVGINACHGHN
jgi:hypothetical protein